MRLTLQKMLNHKLMLWLSLILLTTSFQGCKAANEILKYSGMQKPTVKVTHVDVQKFSLITADFVFDLEISNPNSVGIDLNGFDYEFYINEKSFVKGNQENSMKIEPKGSSTVHIPLTVDFADIFSIFSDLATKKKASYQLVTGFHFEVPVLGKVRVPATKKGEFELN